MGKLSCEDVIELGVGPFAYVPFIIVFLKTNDSAYDTRQSVHKTMGVVTYVYILINLAMGTTMWPADAAVFLFTSFFFYRAMSENFENLSIPGFATMAVFAALSLYVGLPDPETKNPLTGTLEAVTGDSKQQERMLKEAQKAIEQMQKTQQQNADLMK